MPCGYYDYDYDHHHMLTDDEMRELLAEVRAWITAEPVAQEYRALKLRMLLRDGHVRTMEAIAEWEALHGRDQRAGFPAP